MAGMDNSMGSGTRREVLATGRRRHQGAGRLHRRKRINQAVELLGYHRKPVMHALAAEDPQPAGSWPPPHDSRENLGREATGHGRNTVWLGCLSQVNAHGARGLQHGPSLWLHPWA